VPPERHQKNTYASETPVTDGERVYVYLGNAGLYAFDMAGQPVWSTPLPPKKMRLGWGPAASPALYRDRIIVVNDNEEGSFLAAFDTRTGRELWRTPRDEASNWSTPFVWQNAERAEIITTGSKKVRSYDMDGRPLWEIAGMSSIHVPTPFAHDGLLYVSSGYVPDPLRPAYVVKPIPSAALSGAPLDLSLKEGETSNAHVVWSQPLVGSFHPSPLVYDGIYYTLLDRGFLTANDAKTGAAIYGRQRISAESSAFTASPWAYNGKIFALSEDGDTFVIEAGKEFKLLGKNSLNEMTLATPAIVNGNLVIRTASRLYRIGRVRP
jgi:outer membrane protein assembly factor BamB